MGRVETRKASRCGECGTITYNAVYSVECDTCGKELNDELVNGKRQFLDFHYFNDHKGNETTVCDWKCLSAWIQQILPHMTEMEFCNMPYIYPESLTEFISILKPSITKKKAKK